MARQSSQSSALSAPQNFIADGPRRRLWRRNGLIVCSALILAGGGAALAIVNRTPTAAESPASSQPDARTASRDSAGRDMTLQEMVQREKDLLAQIRQLDFPAVTGTPSRTADAAQPDALPKAEPSLVQEAPTSTQFHAGIPTAPETTDTRNGSGSSAPPASPQRPSIELADRYLGRGQYTIARYLYEELYRQGDVLGALGMAKSFDANYLKTIGLRSKGDPGRARVWYRRAAQLSNGLRKETP